MISLLYYKLSTQSPRREVSSTELSLSSSGGTAHLWRRAPQSPYCSRFATHRTIGILRPPPKLEGADHVGIRISLHNEWTPFLIFHLPNLRPVSPELAHASGQRTPSTVRHTPKQRLFPENHHFASLSCLKPITDVLLGRRLSEMHLSFHKNIFRFSVVHNSLLRVPMFLLPLSAYVHLVSLTWLRAGPLPTPCPVGLELEYRDSLCSFRTVSTPTS